MVALGWMPNMQKPSITSCGSLGPLSPYIAPYLTQIREQGFGAQSLREQTHVLKACDCWFERKGHQACDLNEAVARECLRRVIKPSSVGRNSAPATLRRFLAMLRQMGVVPDSEAWRPNPSEQLTRAYERFLVKERNLEPRTVAIRRLVATRFLSEKFGSSPLKLSNLHAPDVTTFVQRHAHDHGPAHARTLVAGMRSFLRYLHYGGLIDTDLSATVPAVAQWRFSTLPKHLSASQVRQVLQHCDRSTPLGRRNYAILLLLARLGLRAGEIIKLNLEDIDWENSRVTVSGKGRRFAQLPLPADVARAIARYLRHDRPGCACRRLFIRDHAPLEGFNRGAAIASVVKRALAKAGVESARKGAHLLRHSLATDLLRKGASLDEIGEVLRHKSPDTTKIYAKVDLKSLRTLALPWPGGAR
jgi:site-specific recombinase XerD